MDTTDEELRRRIRAAMGASGLDTWPALAAATGLSQSLLRNLGKGRDFELKHLNAIRAACAVPYEWFTVPDLAEAVRLGADVMSAGQQEEARAAVESDDARETAAAVRLDHALSQLPRRREDDSA